MDESSLRTVAELLSRDPKDAEWARRVVAPFRNMTPCERLQAQSVLNRWAEELLDGRTPEREDGELPFWMLWKDPLRARPR